MPLFSFLAFKNAALSTLVPTVLSAFAIQAAVAVPSIVTQNEQFYDLSGSLTFLTCTAVSLYLPALRARSYAAAQGLAKPNFPSLLSFGPRKLILSAMVAIWAGRLGTFLYARIKKAGKDPRFDEIKTKPLSFFGAFMAQATWVTLVAGPVFAVNAIPTATMPALGLLEGLGLATWLSGMLFEIVADRQKSAWRKAKDSKKHSEQFISSGLWSKSRHPNCKLYTLVCRCLVLTLVKISEKAHCGWVHPYSPSIHCRLSASILLMQDTLLSLLQLLSRSSHNLCLAHQCWSRRTTKNSAKSV